MAEMDEVIWVEGYTYCDTEASIGHERHMLLIRRKQMYTYNLGGFQTITRTVIHVTGYVESELSTDMHVYIIHFHMTDCDPSLAY